MSQCSECSATISPRGKTGLCKSCFMQDLGRRRKHPDKHCLDCDVKISLQGTRCRDCNLVYVNSLDRVKSARIEGIHRKWEDPEFRAKMAKVSARNSQKASVDPVVRAKLVENGRKKLQFLYAPEARAKWLAGRAKAGARRTDTVLAWCPPEYRDLHRHNCISKRMKAADSRDLIERMIAEKAASKHAREALEFLRRYVPVSIVEDGYRVGNAILTAAEVVHRAKFRGWQPERWAA